MSSKSDHLHRDANDGDTLEPEGIVGMSKRSRKELDIMNALHNTGVQFDIDLPQIIAVGMQSSGKSSLIEAFSGTSLPRAAGTCTRCPTECRLTKSDSPWKCIVSLRFIADSKGLPLGHARIERFGEVIYQKDQVEDRVRRAQRAILNPDKSAELFLHGGQDEMVEEESELTFSVNCVTLEISGPNVADLSFCDLPGLIASVTGGERSTNDIALVESLVTSYMKKSSSIILLTVACESEKLPHLADFENQGAHHLAKKYDPKGRRTVGVLTKPDRIPTGEERNWIQFIRNDKEPLENNWFCVKQPSSQELKANISWTKARENESVFFRGSPWSELEAMYQNRLGTQKLVERLSRILSELISERIPQIRLIIEASIASARAALSQLPPPPSDNPRTDILMMLYDFVNDVRRHVDGVPENEDDSLGLIQSIRPEHESFHKAIQASAPRFVTREKGILLEGSYNDENDIYIDEVYQKATKSRTRELPGHYPFSVQKTYIRAFVQKWKEPSFVLAKVVFKTLCARLQILVKNHFHGFGQGILERRVSATVQQHAKESLDKTEERIIWLLRTEEYPFSLNGEFYTEQRSKYLAEFTISYGQNKHYNFMQFLKDHLHPKPVQPRDLQVSPEASPAPIYASPASIYHCEPGGIGKVLSSLKDVGLPDVKAEDIPKLFFSDQMEPALIIMADVRAYFEVAYKRYVDNVPLAVDLELVRGIEENLMIVLMSGLGINGPDGDNICKDFAEENPHMAERRAELKNKLERLQNAYSELGFPAL